MDAGTMRGLPARRTLLAMAALVIALPLVAASAKKAAPTKGSIRFVLGSPWLRLSNLVVDVAFTPGGEVVAVDGTANVGRWSAATGAPQGSFTPDGFVIGVWHALSPDGTVLAASQEKQHFKGPRFITFWDTATGKKLGRLDDHPASFNSMAISPDGSLVATADTDDRARLWDRATGKVLRELKAPYEPFKAWTKPPQGDSARASAASTPMAIYELPPEIWEEYNVSFSPDGKLVGTAHHEGEVKIFEAATGKLLHRMQGVHAGPAPAFLPGGKRVAYVAGGEVKLYDMPTAKDGAALPRGSMNVMDRYTVLAASNDGKTLAAGTNEADVWVWDLDAGGGPGLVRAHADRLEALAFSADDRKLATGARDGGIGVWDLGTLQSAVPIVRHFGWVESLAVSPDSALAATAGADASIHVWSLETGKLVRELRSEQSFRRVWMDHTVLFSSDGKLLTSTSTEGDLVVWEAATGKEVLRADMPSVPSDAALSPDGKTLAVVGAWGSVVLLDAKTGQSIRSMQCSGGWGYHFVRWLPGGKRLVTTGMDSKLRIWKASSGALVQETVLDHAVYQLALRPGDAGIWIRSYDQLLRYARDKDGTFVKKGNGHPAPADVAFSADGALVAVPTDKRTVVIRDADTFDKIAVLPEAPAQVGRPAFTPDGAMLLAVLADSTLAVWDLGAGTAAP